MYIPGELGHVGSGAHQSICWVTTVNVTNIVWNFNQLACPKLPGAKIWIKLELNSFYGCWALVKIRSKSTFSYLNKLLNGRRKRWQNYES